jgi:hypothetical protein
VGRPDGIADVKAERPTVTTRPFCNHLESKVVRMVVSRQLAGGFFFTPSA